MLPQSIVCFAAKCLVGSILLIAVHEANSEESSPAPFDGTLNATIGMGGTPVPILQTFGARRVGDCQ